MIISLKQKQEFASFIVNGPNKSNSKPVKCLEHIIRFALIVCTMTLIKSTAENWLKKNPIQVNDIEQISCPSLAKTDNIGRQYIPRNTPAIPSPIVSREEDSNAFVNFSNSISEENTLILPTETTLSDDNPAGIAASLPVKARFLPPTFDDEWDNEEEEEVNTPPIFDYEEEEVHTPPIFDYEGEEVNTPPTFDDEWDESLQLADVINTGSSSSNAPESSSITPTVNVNTKNNFQKIRDSMSNISYNHLLTSDELKTIIANRNPLLDVLKNFFDLDEYGYIIRAKPEHSIESIALLFEQKEVDLTDLFYQVSALGDSAYAEDIRTTLAGMNIASGSVKKETKFPADYLPNQSDDPKKMHHPVTFTKHKNQSPLIKFQKLDCYKKGKKGYEKPRKEEQTHITAWDHAIWTGYRAYRRKVGANYKSHDDVVTPTQKMDYWRRIARTEILHSNGLLLGRKTDIFEPKNFISHHYSMNSSFLSTTLFPKKNSRLYIEIFQQMKDRSLFGLFLDPTRVGKADFGVSIQKNGETGNDRGNFFAHKQKRIKGKAYFDPGAPSGASSIDAQLQILNIFEERISRDETIENLNKVVFSLNDDASLYDTNKAITAGIPVENGSKSLEINEKPKNSSQNSFSEVSEEDVNNPARIAAIKAAKIAAKAAANYKSLAKNGGLEWNEQTFNRAIEKDFFTAFFITPSEEQKDLNSTKDLQERTRRKKGMYIPIFIFDNKENTINLATKNDFESSLKDRPPVLE